MKIRIGTRGSELAMWQARFVAGMNEEFSHFNDDSNFATAIVGTFFASTGSLQLCAAGHPQPLLFRRQTGRWEVTKTAGEAAVPREVCDLPLGIAGGVEYSQSRLSINPGDMLLAYTDGLTETVQSAGEMFGQQRLAHWLVEAAAARQDAETMKQEEYLKELVAAYPNDERAQMALGNFYFGMQDYKSAIDIYLKVTAINPEFSQVRIFIPSNKFSYFHLLTSHLALPSSNCAS